MYCIEVNPSSYPVISLIDNGELFAAQLRLPFVRCIKQVSTIVIDVGTDNEKLLKDPLYMGLKQNRIQGAEYLEVRFSRCHNPSFLLITITNVIHFC